MSCTLSHECRVMLSSLLTASTDATRVWLRAEMDRTVDPMLHSIFNRLKTKLINGMEQNQSGDAGDWAQAGNRNPRVHDQSVAANVQIHQPSTSSHFNPQFVYMNSSCQQQNGPNHLNSIISKQRQSHSQPMTIKEESEPMHPSQVQSCSYEVSNEQSNHNLIDQHSNNDEWDNLQINLPDTKMQPQPKLFSHIKHNQFDDEECDCDECVDVGIEVKENAEDDDQVDKESSRPVKRPRTETTQQNNAQAELVRQSTKLPTDEAQLNENRPREESDRMVREQSEGIETRATIGNCSRDNSDESMEIQQEESDANNAIGEELRSNECTANPIQVNLAQPNRHLQCSHCHKSFEQKSDLTKHLRVHTGERPFHCDECDKRFSDRSNLTRHQLIHQNIKRFRCDQCDKNFSEKKNLKIHQMIHQNIKNFQCHQCDKQFTQKPTLHFHLLTHSGEQPFACRHCDKSFAKPFTRNSHEQAIHLHVKPYRCKQCGHTATQRSDLIAHIRIVHFGLPQTIKKQRALNIIDDRDPRELVEKV